MSDGRSLSPRPDSPTRITAPGRILREPPRPGKACADSSAGRIPSSVQHVWNAARASSSGTELVAGAARRREQRVLGPHRRGSRARPRSNACRAPARHHPGGGARARRGARPAFRERSSRRAAPSRAASAGLEPVKRDAVVLDERVEESDGVGAAAHAGGDRIRKPAAHRCRAAPRASRPMTAWSVAHQPAGTGAARRPSR